MDDNSVGKWILPAMGVLTALYFYNNLHDEYKTSDKSKKTTKVVDNKIIKENDEVTEVNQTLIDDADDADILSIIKTKDTSTHISESFLKQIENAEEDEKDVQAAIGR